MRRVPIPKLHRRKLPSGAMQWFTWTRGQFVALGCDEKEARQRLGRLMLGEDPDDGNDEELTVADLTARYWRHLEQKYGSENLTLRGEADRLAHRPLVKLFGASPARQFGSRDLRLLQAEFAKSGLSRGEVNRRVQRVRRMFKWAVAEQIVPPDLHHALCAVEHLQRGELGVKEGRKVQPVPWEHVEPVLPHVSKEVGAIVQLLWLTGARPGEIVGMRPLDIVREGDVWKMPMRHHKNAWRQGHSRTICFGPQAQAVLSEFLNRVPAPDESKPLFSPVRAEAERSVKRRIFRVTPMTPSQRRRKRKPRKERKRPPRDGYSVVTLRGAILRGIGLANVARLREALHGALAPLCGKAQTTQLARALRVLPRRRRGEERPQFNVRIARHVVASLTARSVATTIGDAKLHRALLKVAEHVDEIPQWRPNALRHSAATRIRNALGLDAAAAMLGHRTLTTTEIYAELDQARAAQVAQALG